MIAQNTIEITNSIQLSVPYLNRFFSKAGQIQKITKDQDKKLVFIQFKSKQSIQKALAFNGRVLDKKPIQIKRQNEIFISSIQNLQLQQKVKKKSSKIIIDESPQLIKLPCLHEFKHAQYKIPIRSQYRLIQHSDIQQDNQIPLQNNPLQKIKTKGNLWKLILDQMTKHIKQQDQSSKQLILTSSMSIWALMQLKLQQINYFANHNQNQKSKYIENFIQEILINKLNTLKNPKIINMSNGYKTTTSQNDIEFGFKVFYPQQPQQQQKFYCQSNEKVFKILCLIYQFSPLLGKIYHELHTNSLILFETKQLLNKIVDVFCDTPSKFFINKQTEKTQLQTNKLQQKVMNEGIINNQNNQISTCFSGIIENYGCYFFQNLTPYEMPKNCNSMIWLQIKNNKIEGPFPYPGFFHCNFIFINCKQKSLSQSSFFILYELDSQKYTIQKKESLLFGQYVLGFQDGQFSLSDTVENTLNFIRFELRKMIMSQRKERLKSKINGISLNQSLNKQPQRTVRLNSKIEQQKIIIVNQQIKQDNVLQMSLNVFYVGIKMIQQQKLISHNFKKLQKCVTNLVKYFGQLYNIPKPQVKVNFSFIEILPQRQKQFNAFKCQNYLINHIDNRIIAANSIIASQQFAQKVAEQMLQQANGNQLFGFKDKKYIGSQIWRLYNKSGARRAKLKISQYNYKKLKSQ